MHSHRQPSPAALTSSLAQVDLPVPAPAHDELMDDSHKVPAPFLLVSPCASWRVAGLRLGKTIHDTLLPPQGGHPIVTLVSRTTADVSDIVDRNL